MEKDHKIILSAIFIILLCGVSFSLTGDMSDITGESFLNKLKFWGRPTSVPSNLATPGVRRERDPVTPTTDKCIDTDGLNLGIKGYCTGTDGVKVYDKCADGVTVDEGFCDINKKVGVKPYTCPNTYMCQDGRCVFERVERYPPEVPPTGSVLLERNFYNITFVSSSVLRDNCELMELEKGIDEHTCNTYRAVYEAAGVGRIEVVVEVRNNEPVDKEEVISDISEHFMSSEGMILNIESWNGNRYYSLQKSSVPGVKSVVVLWASGNKIIAIAVDDWNTYVLDDDMFEAMLEAYFNKYPSDL